MGRAFDTEVLFTREGGSGPEADLQDVLGAPVVFLGVCLPDDGWHAPNEKVEIPCCSRAPRPPRTCGTTSRGRSPGDHPTEPLAALALPGPRGSPLSDLALARAVVDRDAHRRTDDGLAGGGLGHPSTRVLAAARRAGRGHRRPAAAGPRHPPGASPEDRRFFLGTVDGVRYFAPSRTVRTPATSTRRAPACARSARCSTTGTPG